MVMKTVVEHSIFIASSDDSVVSSTTLKSLSHVLTSFLNVLVSLLQLLAASLQFQDYLETTLFLAL